MNAGDRHWGGVRSATAREGETEWEFVVDERVEPTPGGVQDLPREVVREGETPRYLVEVQIGEKAAVTGSGRPFPAIQALYVDERVQVGIGRQPPVTRAADSEWGVELLDDADLPAVVGHTAHAGAPVPDELVERFRRVLRDVHGLEWGEES